MRLASDINPANPAIGLTAAPVSNTNPDSAESRYSDYKIIRRNGSVGPFEPTKIAIAMTKAFLAVEGGTAAASTRVHETVDNLTKQITSTFKRSRV